MQTIFPRDWLFLGYSQVKAVSTKMSVTNYQSACHVVYIYICIFLFFCFCRTSTEMTLVTLMIRTLCCCRENSQQNIHPCRRFYQCASQNRVRVVSMRTNQVYNNHVIWITYIHFHQNSEKFTNLHAQGFIIDPINITLETQNKKRLSSGVELTAPLLDKMEVSS